MRKYSSLELSLRCFTLLALTSLLLYSFGCPLAVSRGFGFPEAQSIPVNVSRTGTRDRLRSRLPVFPSAKTANPDFFGEIFGENGRPFGHGASEPSEPSEASVLLEAIFLARARALARI